MFETGTVPSPALLFTLDGRTAVVTGASSGLGRRFAQVLHAAGATVVVAARREKMLASLAEELGERIVPFACDVTDELQCEGLVEAARNAAGHGRIDVLVNNAGIGDVVPAESEPYSQFREVIDVNLNALFRLTQLVGNEMLSQGSGSIVNIASVLGMVASTPIKQAGYCASKGAVVNLTRELGAQWAGRGVRVNALAPGWFRSEMTEEMYNDAASNEFVRRNCPLRRFGAEHELDGALLFLASDASTYVVGQTIAVDGGWTAR